MIENAEIVAMKKEKEKMLPDCYHSDSFGYRLPQYASRWITRFKK
jgi:hypothetical protein